MLQARQPMLDFYHARIDNKQSIPIFTSISAGFPSPAEGFYEKIDLNEWIIKSRASTFFIRVQGDSMRYAGIFSNDILVIDRSITAKHRDIVVAVYNYEFTVRRIIIDEGQISLETANTNYSSIKLIPGTQFEIWGVVTHVIHKV